jgi:uncharacterized protein
VSRSRAVIARRIEFDAAIASVDVLYDLAFPVMDFVRYGRHAAANALLNRYLNKAPIEHFDALAALPLFMSLRAAIRANVLIARLDRAPRPDSDALRSSSRDFWALRRYLSAACWRERL